MKCNGVGKKLLSEHEVYVQIITRDISIFILTLVSFTSTDLDRNFPYSIAERTLLELVGLKTYITVPNHREHPTPRVVLLAPLSKFV